MMFFKTVTVIVSLSLFLHVTLHARADSKNNLVESYSEPLFKCIHGQVIPFSQFNSNDLKGCLKEMAKEEREGGTIASTQDKSEECSLPVCKINECHVKASGTDVEEPLSEISPYCIYNPNGSFGFSYDLDVKTMVFIMNLFSNKLPGHNHVYIPTNDSSGDVIEAFKTGCENVLNKLGQGSVISGFWTVHTVPGLDSKVFVMINFSQRIVHVMRTMSSFEESAMKMKEKERKSTVISYMKDVEPKYQELVEFATGLGLTEDRPWEMQKPFGPFLKETDNKQQSQYDVLITAIRSAFLENQYLFMNDESVTWYVRQNVLFYTKCPVASLNTIFTSSSSEVIRALDSNSVAAKEKEFEIKNCDYFRSYLYSLLEESPFSSFEWLLELKLRETDMEVIKQETNSYEKELPQLYKESSKIRSINDHHKPITISFGEAAQIVAGYLDISPNQMNYLAVLLHDEAEINIPKDKREIYIPALLSEADKLSKQADRVKEIIESVLKERSDGTYKFVTILKTSEGEPVLYIRMNITVEMYTTATPDTSPTATPPTSPTTTSPRSVFGFSKVEMKHEITTNIVLNYVYASDSEMARFVNNEKDDARETIKAMFSYIDLKTKHAALTYAGPSLEDGESAEVPASLLKWEAATDLGLYDKNNKQLDVEAMKEVAKKVQNDFIKNGVIKVGI